MRRIICASMLLFFGLGVVATAQDTQVRGYWVDPTTGLMWAGKDNGKDINWKKAMKYCRDLRLAGYSDWKLATLDQLQGIYDSAANSPGENPPSRWHGDEPMTFHIKGNLFLTGINGRAPAGWTTVVNRVDIHGDSTSMMVRRSAETKSGLLRASAHCVCAVPDADAIVQRLSCRMVASLATF